MEIIQDLLVKCNSEQAEIRFQAEQVILQMREEDRNSFLQQLSLFLSSNDHSSDTLDALALILAYQTIPFTCDLNEFNNDLIDELLNISSFFFSSNDCTLRSSAATLFSRIMLNDQILGKKFETIDFLLNLFQHATSPIIIHPLSIVIYDYCYYFPSSIDSNFILLIFESLAIFFQIESSEIDCYCLKIISNLIPSMGEIIIEEIEKLFSLLLQYCQNPSTAASSFECFALIATHFYPLLDDYLPIITSNEFIDLISISDELEDNNEIINSYLLFWESISQNEIDCEHDNHNYHIIDNAFYQLIPILLKIASLSQSEVCDSDSNEPSVQAVQTLNIILSKYIDKSRPILESFIAEFESSELFGEREAALSCVFLLLQHLDDEDISEEDAGDYFKIIKKGLSDEIPRVRQNAVYCSQPFVDMFQTDFSESIEIMQDLIMKIVEDEIVSVNAAFVVGNFFSIEDFPFFEESMIALVELSSSMNLEYSDTAFKSLSQFVDNADTDDLQKLLDILIQILESCSSISEFHLYKLIDLLNDLIFKLKDQINDKFEIIWDFLSEGVTKFPSLFVLPISGMSLSCPEKFYPYIESTLSLINHVLNNEYFQSACAGFKILLESTDLSDFEQPVLEILDSLLKLLNDEEISAPNKSAVIEVFGKINEINPPLFASILETILPVIEILSLELDDWEDFDSNSSYLRFFNGVLMIDEEDVQQECKLVACKSIFYILSLVIKCPKMDIYHLDSVIDALYLISQIFPDLLVEFYQQNLVLEMTLKYSLSVKETDKLKIKDIFDVINF